MNPELKRNLSNGHYWVRALYVLLFVLLAHIALYVLLAVAFLQVLFSVITGQHNARLTGFGASLALYLKNAYDFVVGQSDEKPFPFADWPEVESKGRAISPAEDTNA
jgi:hypothetical protein